MPCASAHEAEPSSSQVTMRLPPGRSEVKTPGSGSAVDINMRMRVGAARRLRVRNVLLQHRASRASAKRNLQGLTAVMGPVTMPAVRENWQEDEQPCQRTGFLFVVVSSSRPARSSLFMKICLSVLYFPLQIAVCIWFLYNILGWSAFIGMAVIMALFPIPSALAGKFPTI
jgi:hypothetical protein